VYLFPKKEHFEKRYNPVSLADLFYQPEMRLTFLTQVVKYTHEHLDVGKSKDNIRTDEENANLSEACG
jgi:hypothetical protein